MSTISGRDEADVNLLLFTAADRLPSGPASQAQPDLITVRDQRLRHLREVLGAQPGDSLRVGELHGLMGRGEVRSIDRHRATISVNLDTPPPPKLPLVLVLALPRPKMLRRILRAVAEFGVAELHLIHSYRVEKSYWQTPVLAAQAMDEFLLLGLAQSRDTVPPAVHCQRRFKPFVEDVLPGLVEGRQGLLAHPEEHPACPRGVDGEALLVIGPEGGFIPYEVEKLSAAGCRPVSLGPRILRVENALTSLLGRLF